MDEKRKRKLAAAATMAFGVGRIVSGVTMATGHGFVGAMLKKGHHMTAAMKFGSDSVKKGIETFKDGRRKWDD